MRLSFLDALVKMVALWTLGLPSLWAGELRSCVDDDFQDYPLRHSKQWSLRLNSSTAQITFPHQNEVIYLSLSAQRECLEALTRSQLMGFGLQSTHEFIPFQLLDREELIKGMSGRHYLGQKAQHHVIHELGRPPVLESLLDHGVTALLLSPYDQLPRNFNRLPLTALPLLDALERTPLARAEWLLYFGLLLDRFEESRALFDEIESRKNGLRLSLEATVKRPVVLIGHFYHGQWFVPGREHPLIHLIRQAGGKYVFDDLNGHGPYNVSLEEVLKRVEQIDLWFPQAGWSTLEEGLLIEGRHRFLLRDPKRSVYLLQKEGPSVRFFEAGPWRPDLVLEDLRLIFQGKPPRHFFIEGTLNG